MFGSQISYKRTSCLDEIKYTTEDTKVKHTNIATIYNDK
jgi:hypothetical protein